INGNTNVTGPASFAVTNFAASVPISIAPNVTLTSSLSLSDGYGFPGTEFHLTGGGTLYLTNQAFYNATVYVNQARLRMDDLAHVSAPGAGGYFRVTLDAGTLQYGGPPAFADSFALTA